MKKSAGNSICFAKISLLPCLLMLCLILFQIPSSVAAPFSLGPSTTGAITATMLQETGGQWGIGLYGSLYGTDSLGSSYSMFNEGGGAFYSYDPYNPIPNEWFFSPLPSAGWNGFFLVNDTNFQSLGLFEGVNPASTLMQAPNGDITLTIGLATGCTGVWPWRTCTGSGNLVFNLLDDPVMLSSLAPNQSVNLIATGACLTAGTSCPSASVSPVPAPSTPLLFGTGMVLIWYAGRRRNWFPPAK